MAMPTRNDRTVLFMNQRGYSDSELSDPLEKALASGGALDETTILSPGTPTVQMDPNACGVGNSSAYIFGGKVLLGQHVRTEENGTCVWSIVHHNKSCCGNMSCGLPQYIDSITHESIQPKDAPDALRDASFPTTRQSGPYDVLTSKSGPQGGCRDKPGPASSKLYCVQSTSPSWAAFRWYKFVDQPGMQQTNLTDTEKAYVQARVEALHKMMPTPNSKWLKAHNAAAEGLCSIDVAAITTPPKGMEYGYVPIVLYEGVEKPPGCDEYPSPATLPPLPAPTPAPNCSVAPAVTCPEKCVADGHCCVGTVSSFSTTSCAQGCIIANNTDSVAACQQVCRDNDKKCAWSLKTKDGSTVAMNNCFSCPKGCDASDGPYECEAGCEFAFGTP